MKITMALFGQLFCFFTNPVVHNYNFMFLTAGVNPTQVGDRKNCGIHLPDFEVIYSKFKTKIQQSVNMTIADF